MMAHVEVESGHLEPARALLDENPRFKSRSRPHGRRTSGTAATWPSCTTSYSRSASAWAIPHRRRNLTRRAHLTESILSERPANFAVLYSLVRSLNNVGMLLYPMGRDPAGAREYHRKALALMNRWVEAEPKNAQALQRLATTLYYEATCRTQVGRRQGRRCWISPMFADPRKAGDRAQGQGATNRSDVGAGTMWRACPGRGHRAELEGGPVQNEMVFFQAACGFALSAGALRDRSRPTDTADAALIRGYTDRAVECLRKAKARGFAEVWASRPTPIWNLFATSPDSAH